MATHSSGDQRRGVTVRRRVAILLSAVMTMTLAMPPGAAGALELTGDVTALDAAYKTERHSLEARHDAETDALEAEVAELLGDLERAQRVERARLSDAATARLVELERVHATTMADLDRERREALSALDAEHRAERAELEAASRTMSQRLDDRDDGPDAGTYRQARRQVERERKAATASMRDAHARELESLRDDARQVIAEHRAVRRGIQLEHDEAVTALAAALKRERAEERRRHEAEIAALDAEADEMTHASQDARSELRTARDEEDARHRRVLATLDGDHEVDRRELDAAERVALRALDTERRSLKRALRQDEQALRGDHAAALEALSRSFDRRLLALARSHAGLKEADAALRRAIDDEHTRRRESAAATFAAREDETTEEYERARDRVERDLRVDLRVAERAHRRAVQAAEQDAERRERRLDRRHRRELRLLRSEYHAYRRRASSFADFADGLTPIEHWYHAPTDPGSPYNVARRIGLKGAADEPTGDGIGVALIDTGVVDVDGLRHSDVVIGPDFSFEDANPEFRGRDTNGHGTHLGGIINGTDAAWSAGDRARDPERFLGIAPDARLVAVKAGAADGAVDVTQVIAAINWVIANKDADGMNIRVINLAFGTDSVQDYRVDPLTYAVERAWRAGIVVVVSAGNDGWSTSSLTSPATDPFVIAVGATQAVDGKEETLASYSSNGSASRGVDIVAPGRSIVGLRNPGSHSDVVNESGRAGERFVRGSGTSQAAAVVSGSVALLLEERPELAPDQVKRLLLDTAEGDRHEDGTLIGAGSLQIDEALKAKTPTAAEAAQTWEPSDGSGSIDAARGSVRVEADGVVLDGETDIFGQDWSGHRWTTDAWSGHRWTGHRWSGHRWTSDAWSGHRWSADMWAGHRWSGASWTGHRWSGHRWTGHRWTSDGWNGHRWSGHRWSTGGWFGAGWSSAETPRGG